MAPLNPKFTSSAPSRGASSAAAGGSAGPGKAKARPAKARNLLAPRSDAAARGSASSHSDPPPHEPPASTRSPGPASSPAPDGGGHKPPNANASTTGDPPRNHQPPQHRNPPTRPRATSAAQAKAADKLAKLYDKQVFTTGEAADVCKVSQQTIIRCFDAGRLQGFRVPGSRFRRIPREDLIRFMKENDIPTDGFGSGKKRVLVVDDDPRIVELWMDMLRTDPRLELRSALTGYDAGIVSSSFKPELMILDYMLPDINGNVVCQTVRGNEQLKDMKIIIVSGVVNQDEIDSLLENGADEFIKKPIDLKQLMQRVETLLEL